MPEHVRAHGKSLFGGRVRVGLALHAFNTSYNCFRPSRCPRAVVKGSGKETRKISGEDNRSLRKLGFSLCGEWRALRTEQTVESWEWLPVPKVYLLHSLRSPLQRWRKPAQNLEKPCYNRCKNQGARSCPP